MPNPLTGHKITSLCKASGAHNLAPSLAWLPSHRLMMDHNRKVPPRGRHSCMHTVLFPQRHHCDGITQSQPHTNSTHSHTHTYDSCSQPEEGDRSAESPAWPLAPSVFNGLSTSQEVTAAGGRCSLSLEGPRRELLATLMGSRTWEHLNFRAEATSPFLWPSPLWQEAAGLLSRGPNLMGERVIGAAYNSGICKQHI